MSGWIKASDEMPVQGAFVDVWTAQGKRVPCAWWDTESPTDKRVFWATYCAPDGESYGVMGGYRDLDVTHWMTIPDPPFDAPPAG